MFEVNGNPILVDEVEVLQILKEQCSQFGLDLFKDIKPTGEHNIMVTCPFHKQGQERRPSFGISRTDGICHCFACGWAGMFDEMVSNIMGYADGGAYGRKWLARNFLTMSVESREPLRFNLLRGSAPGTVAMPGFTEEELKKYRVRHPYMYERGLNDFIIELFDVGYDSSFSVYSDNNKTIRKLPCLTFPVHTLQGQPAFIARRAVTTKFFHYPVNVEKPLYCADKIVEGGYPEVIITESIFDALSCWQVGRPAVALLGTGTEYQYSVLKQLPARKYIIGTDPDSAGRHAAQKLYNNLKQHKVITFFEIPKGQDLNDIGEGIIDLPEYFN